MANTSKYKDLPPNMPPELLDDSIKPVGGDVDSVATAVATALKNKLKKLAAPSQSVSTDQAKD